MRETLRPLPRLCEVGDSPGNATTDGCLVRVRGRGRGRGREHTSGVHMFLNSLVSPAEHASKTFSARLGSSW